MKKILLILLLVAIIGVGGGLLWANRHPEIAAITPPDPSSFDPELVRQGEVLAGFGNCRVCHTREGGRAYAGGLALPTPFGTIYTSNLTPDAATGIGTWSQEAFARAMRHGIDRRGGYLYPAFPYDYFARVSDADVAAIYAFLMSQPAVEYTPPANELGFPFNQRILMAGWNLLFHDATPFRPDPQKDEEWNRGAYLVEGLGHCGACHSTRNALGAAPKAGRGAYAGGDAEGWVAPPLTAASPAPVPWTQFALVDYLIDGWEEDHGVAGGPMGPITDDFHDQDEDDVFAIAAYVMSLKGGEPEKAAQKARAEELQQNAAKLEWGAAEAPAVPDLPLMQQGAKVFEAQCAECHKANGKPVALALNTALRLPDANNFLRAVIYGIQAPLGSPDRSMPARGMQISDQDLEALAAFSRNRFAALPPWEGIAASIRAARAGSDG